MPERKPTFDDVRQGSAGWVDEVVTFAETRELSAPGDMIVIPGEGAAWSPSDPP